MRAVTLLAESALPPSQIVPPIDVLYADKYRVAMLYSQLEPEFAERKRAVTSENKDDNSFALERKPLTLTLGGSKQRQQTGKRPTRTSTSTLLRYVRSIQCV